MDFLLELLEIWKTPLSTLIGVLAGFGLSFFNERLRERRLEQKRREKTKQLLLAVIEEIKLGVSRAETIMNIISDSDGKGFSPSRIYTGVWDATKADFVEHLNKTDDFHLILDCYRRFDLVNYNAERVLQDRGAAAQVAGFAKMHQPEIKKNLRKLKKSEILKES
jgi:hypothetical protein